MFDFGSFTKKILHHGKISENLKNNYQIFRNDLRQKIEQILGCDIKEFPLVPMGVLAPVSAPVNFFDTHVPKIYFHLNVFV